MEFILASIHPRWCEKIFDGSKTIELRKTAPKKTPFRVYVYCTLGNIHEGLVVSRRGAALFDRGFPYEIPEGSEMGNGMVIGEFVCRDVDEYTKVGTGRGDMNYLRLDKDWYTHPIDYSALCLSREALEAYGGGKLLYGWHITNPQLYDKPRPLTNYHRPCPESLSCESCAMHNEHPVPFCGNYALEIRRPPQSWMYAEDQT